MEYLFIIPALIALFLVVRGRADLAFFWVYLPCLLLLPQAYYFHIPHLPVFSAAQGILFPLGLFAFARWIRGPFKRMDLWVVLFMVSISLSECLREPDHIDGVITAVTVIDSILFSYLIGRKLIEPMLRAGVVKQIIVLVLCQLPIFAWEARMGINLYQKAGVALGFPFVWHVQIRGGHARISGSFSDAELAGIAFAVCLLLNAWLIWINRDDLENARPPRLGGLFSKLERYWIPGWILLIFLALTRSRGPILGAAAGLFVLQIARFKKRRKLILVSTAIVLLLGAATTYAYFSSYVSGPMKNAEQRSAAYRFELLRNYDPIVKQGGWLGWGILFHPTVAGQWSTDNEYLLVHLGYGRLGMICFYLIVVESLWYQSRCVLRFRRKEDFQFAVALLAALLVIWIAIATVYLGEQLPQLTFLLIGWGQSLTESRENSLESPPAVLMPEPQRMRVFS